MSRVQTVEEGFSPALLINVSTLPYSDSTSLYNALIESSSSMSIETLVTLVELLPGLSDLTVLIASSPLLNVRQPRRILQGFEDR